MKFRIPTFKRLLQFRLRTFLLMILGIGMLSGWIANAKVQRDRELIQISKLSNASAKAPYEIVRQSVFEEMQNQNKTIGMIFM